MVIQQEVLENWDYFRLMKQLATSGGGGAIITNDVKMGERAKFLTTTAKEPHLYDYFHSELGYNFKCQI